MRSSMIRLTVEERGLVPIQDFIFLDYGSLRTRADCRECCMQREQVCDLVEGGAFWGEPMGRVSQCGKFIGTQSYTSLSGKSAMNLIK